jgi:hypothetical protein
MKRNLYPLRLVVNHGAKPDTAEAFRRLTTSLVMARAEAGTLNPRVLEYLLAGVGLHR